MCEPAELWFCAVNSVDAASEMGFYAQYVLPHIINVGMNNREMARLRADSIPLARGDVLEVGIGSGRNLPFYSTEVRCVYGLEPSPELRRMAIKRARGARIRVEMLPQLAEDPLPLANGSIDTIV